MEITYQVRHIAGYEPHSAEAGDAVLKLACRDDSGAKIWVDLSGISLGEIVDYIVASGCGKKS